MGRRPNAVVGEFFHRGQKLDNSSNRYQHTCKKCGEHFAKGRIDSMMNHLLKRCPNMTQDDRNLVFVHMQQNASSTGRSKKQIARSHNDTHDAAYAPAQMPSGVHHGLEQQTLPNFPIVDYQQQVVNELQHRTQQAHSSNLPIHVLVQGQQSALDTLAEVSHRHMNYSVQNTGYEMQHNALPRQPNRVEQALLAALEGSNVSTTTDDIHHNHAPTAVEPDVLPMYPECATQAQAGVQQPAFLDAPTQMPMARTATAATEQIEPTHETEDTPLDPHLDDQRKVELTPTTPDRVEQQKTQENVFTLAEKPHAFVSRPDLPSNDPNPDFSVPQKSDKVNARSRFTDTRRKEVQEIRKRGACMRCRMLKKPCSEGTPCGTCKKIDSARLWKGTCLRTKLAEEFTLYSVSYFHSKMATQVEGVLQGSQAVPLSGRIEVRFLGHAHLAITLQAGSYVGSTAAEGINGNLQTNAIFPATDSRDFFVLTDDRVSQQLSEYCNKDATIETMVEQEEQTFLKETLREAVRLLEIERSRGQSLKQKVAPRSNSISPSVLLQNVIELCIETSLLVSRAQESLQIRYNATMPSSQHPHTVVWPNDGGQVSPAVPLDLSSQNIIRSQLLAATETACHRLSKAILNELERRLLQRQQVSSFATFISAIILFTCMERITAFYYSLDPSPSQSVTVSTDSTTADVHPHPDPRPAGYPLSVPAPSALWPQGPHFARLLTTLLRMRALPPKTIRTSENKLAVLLEPGLPVRLNGVAVWEQQDENTARASEWLNLLSLDVDELKAKRDGDVAATGWEMKFVSEVLLGEGI